VTARVLAAFAFAAMIAGGIERFYFRALFLDASAWRPALTELPWRKLPGYRRFLLDVDARTPPGARIALWMPAGGDAYSYGYVRAPFLLPGKQLVPAPAAQAAEFIAAWHGAPAIPGFEIVWRSGDGVLMRRVR
jgi:hypothetical protein